VSTRAGVVLHVATTSEWHLIKTHGTGDHRARNMLPCLKIAGSLLVTRVAARKRNRWNSGMPAWRACFRAWQSMTLECLYPFSMGPEYTIGYRRRGRRRLECLHEDSSQLPDCSCQAEACESTKPLYHGTSTDDATDQVCFSARTL
jgi:hypothetical protein